MIELQVDSCVIQDISLVIFDKDGTLMELFQYWSNMIRFRVDLAQKRLGFPKSYKKEIMYAMGVDLDNKRIRSEGPVGIKKREIVMQAMVDALVGLGFPVDHDTCKEIFSETDKISLEHLSEIIKPIKGMRKLLSDLHNKGCKVAIATTDKTERAELAVKILGISDNVNLVIGEDMVKRTKPAPDMVNMILDKLKAAKDNTVIVGDAVTDIEMGINAGLKASIGVTSGLTSKENLFKKTRYVINDISKIAAL